MTGTGDGRVFLFGGTNPAKLVELDRNNGQPLNVLPLVGISSTNAFAFAFFGGDMYFFNWVAIPGFTRVIHLDYDDSDASGSQELTTVVPQAGIRVIAAGVSTCAPSSG